MEKIIVRYKKIVDVEKIVLVSRERAIECTLDHDVYFKAVENRLLRSNSIEFLA